MCLRIAVERPEDVLDQGMHNGFEWIILANRNIGVRCGYIKVLPEHPWHGKHYDDVSADVHGGLTFSEADVPCDAEGEDNGWWLGFDCGRVGDGWDRSIASHPDQLSDTMVTQGPIRDTDYVRDECIALANQASHAE